jgi:nucleoside-diphosphate-sugar epimerase
MIAVTGANGLAGSYIVRKLHALSIPFIALKREGSDTSFLKDIQQQITWRDADITDSVSLREALEGVTGVIHTAAYVSFNPRKRKTVFEINTIGTQHVVNACLHLNIKRLLHVSSVAALGRQKGQTHLKENNKWVTNGVASNYAESKYKAELEVFRGHEEGLSTIIMNPSVILGYSNWDKSSAQLFQYSWKEKPFYINGSLNYVDVRDVAEIAVKLFHSPIENERFIVSAGNIPFLDFFTKTAQAFQKKAPTIKVNPTVASILARLESVRIRLTGSEPLITIETARLADAFFEYDNQKVKKLLDYQFQSIDNTINWCCQQYAGVNGIKNQ